MFWKISHKPYFLFRSEFTVVWHKAVRFNLSSDESRALRWNYWTLKIWTCSTLSFRISDLQLTISFARAFECRKLVDLRKFLALRASDVSVLFRHPTSAALFPQVPTLQNLYYYIILKWFENYCYWVFSGQLSPTCGKWCEWKICITITDHLLELLNYYLITKN